jgi:hypothetical protein
MSGLVRVDLVSKGLESIGFSDKRIAGFYSSSLYKKMEFLKASFRKATNEFSASMKMIFVAKNG